MGELALPCQSFDPEKNVCSIGLRPCDSWKAQNGKNISGVKEDLIKNLDQRFKLIRDGLEMDKTLVLYRASDEDRAKSGGHDLILDARGGGKRGFVAVMDLKDVSNKNSFEPYDGGRACNPLSDQMRRTGRKHPYSGAAERVRNDTTRGSVSCGFPGYTDRSGNNYLAGQEGQDRPGNRVSLEISYRKGAWLAAQDCYLAQVKKEIQENKFTVRSPACKAIAADIRKLYTGVKGLGDSVSIAMENGAETKNLCSKAALEAQKPVPDFCSADGGSEKERIDYQITGCQLAAMRSNIEAAYVELASCEINARALEARNIAFVDSGKEAAQRDSQFSKFYEKWLVKGQVVQKYSSSPGPACEARAENFARSKGGRKCRRACAEAHGAREASRCYDENIDRLWIQFLKYHFPQNGACKHTSNQKPAPSQSMPLELLLGSLVLPPIRRRRKLPVSVGPSLIIVGMAFFWAACGGSKGGSQGVAQYPPFEAVSKNNTPEDDNLRLQENQKGAADRNNAALSNAFEADRLVSGANKQTGESMQAAAKAGAFDKKNVEFKGRSAIKGGANSSENNTKTASAGGGGAGGGGGGLGGSTLSTDPGSLLTLQGDPGGMVEDANAAGGQYSGGNSRGGAGTRRSKSDNLFGSNSLEGADSSMQFGNNKKGDVNAMGSEDPADYFSRIGVFESIFKRVSNRYQEKSRAWATTDAAEVATPPPPVVK